MNKNQVSRSPKNYSKTRTEIDPLLPAQFDSVLEIGCGAGETMAWLRSNRSVKYAAAVEISKQDGEIARLVFDDLEIGDIASAPMAFKTEQFDLVIVLDVLEHLVNPEQALKILLSRLKPGGTIIISLPNVSHYLVSVPLLLRGRWEYQNEGLLDRTHLRFFTENSAQELLEKAGVAVKEVQYNFHYPSIFRMIGLKGSKWSWYSHKILRHILIWPSHLFKYQFLIAGKKPT